MPVQLLLALVSHLHLKQRLVLLRHIVRVLRALASLLLPFAAHRPEIELIAPPARFIDALVNLHYPHPLPPRHVPVTQKSCFRNFSRVPARLVSPTLPLQAEPPPQKSNLDQWFRKPPFYPLNYG